MCHLKKLAFWHQSAQLFYHLRVVILKKIDGDSVLIQLVC